MSPAIATRVDIVTGASQGIGRAIAESIAFHQSQQRTSNDENSTYKLVLVGRSQQRGQEAAASIQESTGVNVVFEACDLSNANQVKELRQKILPDNGTGSSTVGILVNNAAECPKRQEFVKIPRKGSKEVVEESVDKQFATNVLGYHFMLRAFEDAFQGNSHVVMVASNWAGDLDLNDVNFRKRRYDNDTAYRQSKQCDRMLSAVWAKRLEGKALVNACHPGDPCTTLSKALGYNLYASAPSKNSIERSCIPFLCGFGKHKVATSGGWYDGDTHPSRCWFSNKTKEAQELFDLCDSYFV